MRAQIAQFVNIERTNRGLPALPVDPGLQQQAQAWSERNREAGCESACHSPHDQGEVLAWAPVSARSSTLMVAWMKSPSHRDIVLYPEATAMGVGIACKHGGEAYATVQFLDVYQPVAPTAENPIATSEEWGSPCEGIPGAMPQTTSTPTTVRRTTTTSTTATTVAPAPRPRPTTTTAPPRPRVTVTTAAPAPVATIAAPASVTIIAPTTTTSTTAPPRVGLRADGTAVNAPTPTPVETEAMLQDASATPASAEPAWVAIVVVVLLLSGMRIGSQLRELKALRRLEDG